MLLRIDRTTFPTHLLETITSLVIYGSALVAPLTPHIVEAAYVPEPESPQAIILRIADEYGINRALMTNMAWSESRFEPLSDNGYDRGLFQINRKYHPEVSDECAFDAECAARWTAQRIKDGYSHEWVSANCYLLVQARLGRKLPLMKDLKPNSMPRIGAVAIFNYKGVPHYAEVISLHQWHFTQFESNYIPGLIGYRDVKWTDRALVGFWFPNEGG